MDRADHALKDPKSLTKLRATARRKTIGALFVYKIPAHAPRWAALFPEQASDLKSIVTSGAGALLFIKRARMFALAFGYSSHLIDPAMIEEGFGLKVALNSVPGDHLRSVDAYTPDTIGKRTKTQGSRMGTIPDFGINIDQDLLRAATGIPSDRTLGKRMTGRDSLSVTLQGDLAAIPAFLDRYLKKSRETTYRKDFGWIDKVREVGDATVISRLNDKLVVQFRTGAFEKTWMAVPDIVEWERIEGFRYGSSKRDAPAHDLHVQDLHAAFRDPSGITLQSLRTKVVNAYDDDPDPPTYHWPAYSCIYSEIEDGGETYLLTNGKWFRIETDFVTEVGKAVRAIPSTFALPPYIDGSERDYNARVAKSDSKRFALMDAKNIPYGGGYSKIEFCDLFTTDGELIHIKRYGGSAVLSHLFQQGVVSASLWAAEPEFRSKVNVLLPKSHRLADPADALERGLYRVIFAITSNRKKPLHESLPFFSKLTLRNAVVQLRGLGYEVELCRIADETAT